MNPKKRGADAETSAAQQAAAVPRVARLEPAHDGAALLAALRTAAAKPSPSLLLRTLQAISPECSPSDAEIQEAADILAGIPADVRMDFYIRLEREHPARPAPGTVSGRVLEVLRTANTQRTDWLADSGALLLSHSGSLDPRRHVLFREQLRAVFEDDSRSRDGMAELVFRLVRKERDAPLLMVGLLTIAALSTRDERPSTAGGASVVNAVASVLRARLGSRQHVVEPALKVTEALLRQLEREFETGDAAATRAVTIERRVRELEKDVDLLEHERDTARKLVDALGIELAARDQRIAELEAQVLGEQSRYRLLDDASRSARLDALRGLIARLRRRLQHEVGDLLEAVGDPKDSRDRLIRARAQTVLQLIVDEAEKVEAP